jgi:hypothetical protein
MMADMEKNRIKYLASLLLVTVCVLCASVEVVGQAKTMRFQLTEDKQASG